MLKHYLGAAITPYWTLKLDRRAVTAIEYALIAALIAVVIITAVTTIGHNAANTFEKVSGEL